MLRFAKVEVAEGDDVLVPIRPLRRVEVEALIELGLFDGERLELLDGSLVALRPSMNLHTIVSARVAAMLAAQLGPAWTVLQHSYLPLDELSMPAPDVVVVPVPRLPERAGHARRHRASPSRPAPLVIEVSDFTFHNDSIVKARLYAEAEIATYWLVDLVHRAVRVHERPVDGQYTTVEECGMAAVLTADGLPAVALPVGEILARP